MAAVAAEAVDVILRHGRTLRARPPRREGADSLLELFRFQTFRARRASGRPRARGLLESMDPPAGLDF
jgi:hypothetical protein